MLSGSLVTAAFAAHTHVPAPDTWTLNVKETDFGGGPTIKSDTDHILADNEQHYQWQDVTVDGSGATTKTSLGRSRGWHPVHPIQGLPGAKFS